MATLVRIGDIGGNGQGLLSQLVEFRGHECQGLFIPRRQADMRPVAAQTNGRGPPDPR